MTYYLQTNSFSQQINQTVEITLRYFVYGLNNPFMWLPALLAIQLIINNTSLSIIGKIPNEIVYSCTFCLFEFTLSIAIPCYSFYQN